MDLVKEIDNQITTLEQSAEALQKIAVFMRKVFLQGELPEETPVDETAPEITLADVRKVLTELSRAGYTDAVRKLIVSRGVSALSEVPKSEYAAILKEAEAITDAA